MGDRNRDALRQRKSKSQDQTPRPSAGKNRRTERGVGWTTICLASAVLSTVLGSGVYYYTNMMPRLAPKMKGIVGIETDKVGIS